MSWNPNAALMRQQRERQFKRIWRLGCAGLIVVGLAGLSILCAIIVACWKYIMS